MIPAALDEFLSAPRFCALGLVDDRGRPHLVRCGGWYRGPAGGPDFVAITRASFLPALPGRGASDRVALLLNEADRFVAYQLKGRGTAREATEEEVERCKAMFAALGDIVEKHWGLPSSLYTSIIVAPAIAIDVVVEEAFAQSPGPGAGRRIGDEG
jgi:hypothetical protein